MTLQSIVTKLLWGKFENFGCVYTKTFLINMATLVFVWRCSVYSHFSLFYQQKLIIHVECGHAVVGKHLKFSTVRCRKCNLVLIDVEVGLLLMFLVSMKAKVCLYHKYVSVLYLYS